RPGGYIHYNLPNMSRQACMFGAVTTLVTLAHETAHYVNDQLGRTFLTSKENELYADRIAGFLLGCIKQKYSFGNAPIDGQAAWERYLIGDKVGDPNFNPFSNDLHGTSDERLKAFLDGYMHGLPADFWKKSLVY